MPRKKKEKVEVIPEETIEQGLRAHGLDEKQIDETIKKMNEMLEKGRK